MMLEISPEMTFAVLSPAFYGNERKIAQNIYSKNGCNFYKNSLCELHNTDIFPFECNFCHHDRVGLGLKCHADLENDWFTTEGQSIARKWCNIVDCIDGLDFLNWIQSKKMIMF